MSGLVKGGLWIVGAGAIAYLLFCSLLWLGQRKLIFVPNRLLTVTPAALGLDYQEVWIPVGSGPDQLHSWWLPATAPANSLTLLYLHGNAGNIGDHLSLASRFQALGLSVLLVDYRGYGLSTGPFPSETRIYEDALTGWHYLIKDRGIAPEQILIFGHSIGGAVAIDLAVNTPQAAGLIVENTFTSMEAMALHQGYGAWAPVKALLNQRFDSLQKVSRLRLPVLFIHGLADLTVPPEMSQQLYEATPSPKWLWSIPGADHNNVFEVAGLEYDRRIRQFLADLALIGRPS
ncbi:alpha/beta fold hydrolase [Pseudanabaena sp. FACHB-2040]|uniref:alpha/beta fold hydrolase n=1 Tax=Pseudanabaena sp. FACHB-2040 TaxID=2692859 RepID=UPI00168A1C58|nr:alpha/beta hydrolase [Pseudanabaena sp. FACHB-2040]